MTDPGQITLQTYQDYDTQQQVVEFSVVFRVKTNVSDELLLGSSYAEHQAMMQKVLETEREALIRSVEEWVAKCRSNAPSATGQ